MRNFLILILLFFSTSTLAIDCVRNPIYCQIVKNKPAIRKSYALRLSNIIHRYCMKYKIPKVIFTGILMQESSYQLKARGCHSGLVSEEICKNSVVESPILPKTCEHVWKEVRICSDFGISQIYYKTARRYGFDIDRLTKDLEYSVKAGAIVLSDFKKRYSHREIDWYTRYNASSRIKRKIYRTLIERYF